VTGAELQSLRQWLGLSAAELGRLLQLEGRDQGRQVRRWETSAAPIPGPAVVALGYIAAERKEANRLDRAARRQESPPEALAAAEPIQTAAAGLEAPAPWKSPDRNRRRR
jgi:hypothetical protein